MTSSGFRPTWLVAGPTASGKTAVAVALAQHVGGEIIGADAFQIYKGLDLLTAKPTAAERAAVPHHLIGEVPLTASFDVAQYLTKARAVIDEVRARGRQPIVVGGTGLYLRALTRGLAELPPADPILRAELETLSLAELQAELRRRDLAGFEKIDRQNPRRLIRALEVCRLTGQPFSSFRREWERDAAPEFRGIALTWDRAALDRRIDQRVEAMFAAGVVEEVAAIREIGPTAQQVLGWREIREVLAGRLSEPACRQLIQQGTRRYARRQMTWLAREPTFQPLEATADDLLEQALAHFAAAK